VDSASRGWCPLGPRKHQGVGAERPIRTALHAGPGRRGIRDRHRRQRCRIRRGPGSLGLRPVGLVLD